MNRQDTEQKQIIIYWWNFGKKTLDFQGTYKDYLKIKGIRVNKIRDNYYKITLNTGCSTFIIKTFETDLINVFNLGISTYLNTMGDKALFIDGYSRENHLHY